MCHPPLCLGNCFGPFRLIADICDCLSLAACLSYFTNATGGMDPTHDIQYITRVASGINRTALTRIDVIQDTALTRAWDAVDVGVNLAGGIDPDPSTPLRPALGQQQTWIDMLDMDSLAPWPAVHDSEYMCACCIHVHIVCVRRCCASIMCHDAYLHLLR